MRAFRRALLLTLPTVLAACGTVTKVPLAWKDPAYTGSGFERIYVIGVAENPGTRRLFEDRFAAVLSDHGTFAAASYNTLPGTERLTENGIRQAMENGRFDGVIITRLVEEDHETTYVPPRTYSVPRTYHGYYGYYRTSWEVVHEPGYTVTRTIVRLETNLYDVRNSALVWSGQSETLDPNTVADTISATAAVAHRLAKDGLIR
jgi:hypothetical protein